MKLSSVLLMKLLRTFSLAEKAVLLTFLKSLVMLEHNIGLIQSISAKDSRQVVLEDIDVEVGVECVFDMDPISHPFGSKTVSNHH